MSLVLRETLAGVDNETSRAIARIRGGDRAGWYLILTDPFVAPPPEDDTQAPPSESESDAPPPDPLSTAARDAWHAELEELGGKEADNGGAPDRPPVVPPIPAAEHGLQVTIDPKALQKARDALYEPPFIGRRPRKAGGRKRHDSRGFLPTGPHAVLLDIDEAFELEPSHGKVESRDLVYAAAPSGAGKSTFGRTFLTRYRELHPRRKMSLISNLNKDRNLPIKKKPLMLQQVDTAALLEDPISVEQDGEFEKSAFIFDDVEALPKAEGEAVHALGEAISTEGRHSSITMLYTSHNLTNYRKTRTILGEMQWYVVFPCATNANQLTRLLTTYGGMDKKQVAQLRGLPSRWAAYRRIFPQCVVYQTGAYILNPHEAATARPGEAAAASAGAEAASAAAASTKKRRTASPDAPPPH